MNAVVHVEVFTEEYSAFEPYRKISEEEFEGTAFGVDSSIFSNPWPGRLFITNFHVVDNAKGKRVRISTAWMGRSKLTGRVVCVVPYLDIAVISVREDDEHDRFSGDVGEALRRIKTLELDPKPLRGMSQKVYTVGFPMGLEMHKTSGTVAGRGTDDMDFIQFNLSLNAGNSGGPILLRNKVVAVATCTMEEGEAISFGVPSTSVLAYFKKWANKPFGKFPRWGFQTMPLTDAYAKEHSYGSTGVVVYKVEPEVKNVKVGDILVGIESRDISVKLDNFGLFHDPTREPMITINNSEFIMKLHPDDTHLTVWRKGVLSVKHAPIPIQFSVGECWAEWNPPKYMIFGSMVFQQVTKTLLADEDVPPTKSIPILHSLEQSQFRKEIVCVSYIHPDGYVSSLGVIEDFDTIQKVGRVKVKSFECFCEALKDVARRWKTGEQKRVCFTTGKKVWLSLDKLASDEKLMASDSSVPSEILTLYRKRYIR